MNHAAEAATLLAQLTAVGTPERAKSEKAYLTSDLAFVGSGVLAMRTVVTAWLRMHPGVEHVDLFAVADSLCTPHARVPADRDRTVGGAPATRHTARRAMDLQHAAVPGHWSTRWPVGPQPTWLGATPTACCRTSTVGCTTTTSGCGARRCWRYARFSVTAKRSIGCSGTASSCSPNSDLICVRIVPASEGRDDSDTDARVGRFRR